MTVINTIRYDELSDVYASQRNDKHDRVTSLEQIVRILPNGKVPSDKSLVQKLHLTLLITLFPLEQQLNQSFAVWGVVFLFDWQVHYQELRNRFLQPVHGSK
jgi:hypothetical protein